SRYLASPKTYSGTWQSQSTSVEVSQASSMPSSSRFSSASRASPGMRSSCASMRAPSCVMSMRLRVSVASVAVCCMLLLWLGVGIVDGRASRLGCPAVVGRWGVGLGRGRGWGAFGHEDAACAGLGEDGGVLLVLEDVEGLAPLVGLHEGEAVLVLDG